MMSTLNVPADVLFDSFLYDSSALQPPQPTYMSPPRGSYPMQQGIPSTAQMYNDGARPLLSGSPQKAREMSGTSGPVKVRRVRVRIRARVRARGYGYGYGYGYGDGDGDGDSDGDGYGYHWNLVSIRITRQ